MENVSPGTNWYLPLPKSGSLAVGNTTWPSRNAVNAGLVTQERSGRNLIYRADFGRTNDLLAYLSENCCQGERPAKAGGGCQTPTSKETKP